MYIIKKAAILFYMFILLSCGGTASNSAPPTSMANQYEIISIQDTSVGNRVRKSVHIVAPAASEYETRAQTALKAAVDVAQKYNADAVGIFLEVSPNLAEQGYVLAIANYAPDGGGWSGSQPFRDVTWEAEATDIVLSEQDIRIGELWYENRGRFQIDDGFGGKMTDEKALGEYLSKTLNIDSENVTLLPLMQLISSRKSYALNQ